MALSDPLNRPTSGSGFGRGNGNTVRPVPASNLPRDAYQNALEHLAKAKFSSPKLSDNGESMRFFNMLIDRGAMDEFVPPERDYNVSHYSDNVDAKLRFFPDSVAEDPEIQSLQSPTDILLANFPKGTSSQGTNEVLFRPYADAPLARLNLYNPDDTMGLRAMAAYLSPYNLPVVDRALEQYMLQLGTGNENAAQQIYAKSELLPEVIQPDIMSFVYRPEENFSAKIMDDSLNFVGDDKKIVWNTAQPYTFKDSEIGSVGTKVGKVISHESGHLLDRLSALFDREPEFWSSSGSAYSDAVSSDISNFPDVNGLTNPIVGWGQQNPAGQFLTPYAEESSTNKTKPLVEDFAERFSLYMYDKQNGYAYTLDDNPVRFAQVYPATSAYFDKLLAELEAGYQPMWRLLE